MRKRLKSVLAMAIASTIAVTNLSTVASATTDTARAAFGTVTSEGILAQAHDYALFTMNNATISSHLAEGEPTNGRNLIVGGNLTGKTAVTGGSKVLVNGFAADDDAFITIGASGDGMVFLSDVEKNELNFTDGTDFYIYEKPASGLPDFAPQPSSFESNFDNFANASSPGVTYELNGEQLTITTDNSGQLNLRIPDEIANTSITSIYVTAPNAESAVITLDVHDGGNIPRVNFNGGLDTDETLVVLNGGGNIRNSAALYSSLVALNCRISAEENGIFGQVIANEYTGLMPGGTKLTANISEPASYTPTKVVVKNEDDSIDKVHTLPNDSTSIDISDYVTPGENVEITINGTPYDVTGDTVPLNGTPNTVEITKTGASAATYTITLPSTTNYTFTPASTGNVTSGDDYTFTVRANTGYTVDGIVVKANEVALAGSDTAVGEKTYTIENVAANQIVTITEVPVTTDDTTFTVTLPTSTEYTIVPISTLPVRKGDDFTFTLAPATGYSIDNLVVTANGVTLTGTPSGNSKIYTIKNIQDNQVVAVTGASQTYTITTSTCTGATITSTTPSPVAAGTNYQFVVTVDEGYDATKMLIKSTSPVIAVGQVGNAYTYQINNVQTNQTIEVSGLTPKTFTITHGTLPNGIKIYPEATETKVAYNATHTFTVIADTGYSIDDATVYANGVALTGTTVSATSKSYTITNIKADQIITITGVKDTTHTITVSDGVGLKTTVSATTVEDGGSITFTVVPLEGYVDDEVVVYVNNYKVKPVSGNIYTLNGIKTDLFIFTDGAMKEEDKAAEEMANMLTISKNIPTGVTFTALNETTVKKGSDFSFILEAVNGYSIKNISVTANGKALKAENGVYTIKNITSNQMIAVTGVSLKTYSITTQCLSGLTISTSDSYNVTPGGSFTFKLSFVSSIDPTTISVKVNGQPITGSSWTYTLNNIQSDKEITVTANNIVLDGTNSVTGGAVNTDKDDPYAKDDGVIIETGDDQTVYSASIGIMILAAAAAAMVSKKKLIKTK